MMLAGFGRYPSHETDLVSPAVPRELPDLVRAAPSLIGRGAGKAYGDAAIGVGMTADLRHLNRMIAFDPKTGDLTAEAGVTLAETIDVFLPRGFFPPVVPGTRHVTLGGMLASNVHGKNHHKSGSFGQHVSEFTLIGADGAVLRCSRTENADLFFGTLGGMGLTGIIRDVTLRLLPVETPFIRRETIACANLDHAMTTLETSRFSTYSVAWVDALATGASLGRSLVFLGEHVPREQVGEGFLRRRGQVRSRGLRLPFDLPSAILCRSAMRAFNALYYRRGVHAGSPRTLHAQSYFFPLDAVGDWNRFYGRSGLLQHQSVFPKENSRDAVGAILERVAREGSPSFLAVLKLMGPADDSLMGFPMEGYTLALDFPANERMLALLEDLDEIVVSNGGRLYLAKDARQKREVLEAGYPRLDQFRTLRSQTEATSRFRSLQSERLGL